MYLISFSKEKKIEAFVESFKMFNLIKQQTCYLLSKFMSLAWQVHRHFQSNSIFYGSKRNEAPALVTLNKFSALSSGMFGWILKLSFFSSFVLLFILPIS